MKTRSGVTYTVGDTRGTKQKTFEVSSKSKRIRKNKEVLSIKSLKETSVNINVRRERGNELMNAIEVRRLAVNDEADRAPLPNETDDDDNDNNEERPPNRRKMSDHLNKIEKLKLDRNVAENWRRFKRNFDIYMTAGELNTKADAIKINTFLNAIGEEAVEVFDTFTLTEEQSNSYNEVIKAFEDFCKPKKNPIYERYLFYKRKQKDGEPFDAFLMDIKRLARTCAFTDRENEMLRDQIVMGIYDNKVQRRLLETSDLTYEQAVEKGRQGESTKEQSNTMSKSSEVNEIRSNDKGNRYTNHVADSHRNNKQHSNNNNNSNNKGQHNRNSNANTSSNKNDKRAYTQYRQDRRQQSQNTSNNDSRNNCKFCNFAHKFGTKNCPAFGKTCNSCSKSNHFSSVCRLKNVSTITPHNDSDYDFDDNNEFLIETLFRETSETDDAYSYPWIERITIEKSSVPFKIDTGAGVDVVPLSVLKRIAPQTEINRTSITLRAFAGEVIRPIGTCSLFCSFHDLSLRVKFAVVDFDCTPILGLKSCIRFNIVKPSSSRVFWNSKQKHKL